MPDSLVTASDHIERRKPLLLAVVDDAWENRAAVQMLAVAHPGEIRVVLETHSVDDLLQGGISFDVVLLDVWLGDDDELSIGRVPDILATGSKVLLHTQERTPAKLIEALDRGASGIALKYEGGPDLLLEAILAVGRGEEWVRSPMAHALLSDTRCARLTLRQREIVALIADGLNYEQAAEALVVSKETIKKTLADVAHRYRELGRPAGGKRTVHEAMRDGHIKMRAGRPEVSP